MRVQHYGVGQSQLTERFQDFILFIDVEGAVGILVSTGRRNDDELLIFAAGELNELLINAGPIQIPAADDQQRPFRRSASWASAKLDNAKVTASSKSGFLNMIPPFWLLDSTTGERTIYWPDSQTICR